MIAMSPGAIWRSRLVGLSVSGAAIACALGVASLVPASASAEQPAATSLSTFLLRSSEAPGFVVAGRVRVYTNLEQGLKEAFKDKGKEYEANKQRLEGEGWRGSAVEVLKSKTEAEGTVVSSVEELGSPEGAESELHYELKRETNPKSLGQTKLRYFKVPGVPDVKAFSFTEDKKRSPVAADAFFVEGSCYFVVGDLKPSLKKTDATVVASVQALHKRTLGTCP